MLSCGAVQVLLRQHQAEVSCDQMVPRHDSLSVHLQCVPHFLCEYVHSVMYIIMYFKDYYCCFKSD